MALSGNQITRTAPGGAGHAYAGFSAKVETLIISLNFGIVSLITGTAGLTSSIIGTLGLTSAIIETDGNDSTITGTHGEVSNV